MHTELLAKEELGAVQRCLWFDRGGHSYALPISELIEVRELPWIRPLPMTLPALAGFTQLRDQIIPVFDPLIFAGREAASRIERPLAAVCGGAHGLSLALILDRVGRVTDLPTLHQSISDTAMPGAFAGRFLIKNEPDLLVLHAAGIVRLLGLRPGGNQAAAWQASAAVGSEVQTIAL